MIWKMAATVFAFLALTACEMNQESTRFGDENGDGVITEDESGWNCLKHGNRICGNDLSS